MRSIFFDFYIFPLKKFFPTRTQFFPILKFFPVSDNNPIFSVFNSYTIFSNDKIHKSYNDKIHKLKFFPVSDNNPIFPSLTPTPFFPMTKYINPLIKSFNIIYQLSWEIFNR
ncbi:unnamed protein product [Meloidogyne enterolobii]|uniref:Uncharacterized protein n=1 Tax=Meloidogyne enterolobii TaxID=390850 RepID=A0ACB0XQ16_MELEN